jgi:hypothetical protein
VTPFQWIFGGLLLAALIVEVILQLTRLTRRRISLFRALVWGVALALVLSPEMLQYVASRLRIGRGADFLLYSLALSFPVGCFYLLHAIEKQRQQITQLVRVLAERDPVHRPSGSVDDEGTAE